MADDTPADRPKQLSRRLRYEILRRDGNTCRYCGGKAPDVAITVDHVIPRALGGTDEPSNLVTACRDCNAGKTSVHPDAPLVDGVAEDAERFAAALILVANRRRSDAAVVTEFIDWFERAWTDWAWTDRSGVKHSIDRPQGWRVSIEQFYGLGLNRQDLHAAIRDAMETRGVRDPWRYFCGIAWREINTRQELARASMGTDNQGEPPDAPALESYNRGYDDGWHDAQVFCSTESGCELCSRTIGTT